MKKPGLSFSKFTRFAGFVFVLIGVFLFYAMWRTWSDLQTDIKAEELTSIEGTLSEDPELGPRKHRSVNIYLDEYPGFVFHLSAYAFGASYAGDLLNKVRKGERLTLTVLKSEYEKELSGKPQGDGESPSGRLAIYGLKDQQQEYLILSDLNAGRREESEGLGFWVFQILALGLCGAGVYIIGRGSENEVVDDSSKNK